VTWAKQGLLASPSKRSDSGMTKAHHVEVTV
jgi:hypothetical protein